MLNLQIDNGKDTSRRWANWKSGKYFVRLTVGLVLKVNQYIKKILSCDNWKVFSRIVIMFF